MPEDDRTDIIAPIDYLSAQGRHRQPVPFRVILANVSWSLVVLSLILLNGVLLALLIKILSL